MGPPNHQCRWCGAFYYASEKSNGVFNKCCTGGAIILDQTPPPHPLLAELFEGNTPEAKHFQKEIRSYNNALTFTSCCYTAHERLRGQGGIQPFQIHGELFHLQGPLQQHEGRIPNYAQLYFHDPAMANTSRMARAPILREHLLQRLIIMLQECQNPFIDHYKTAKDCLDTHDQCKGRSTSN